MLHQIISLRRAPELKSLAGSVKQKRHCGQTKVNVESELASGRDDKPEAAGGRDMTSQFDRATLNVS